MNNKIVIGVFFLSITLPLIVHPLKIKNTANQENRKLTELPQRPTNYSEVKNFFGKFDNYLNDNVPFRSFMISSYNTLCYQLGVSPSKSIIIGKNGWLFSNFDNAVNQYIGRSYLGKAKTEKLCTVIQKNAEHFESQNIPFYFLMAPNKHSIFSEYLPDYVNRIKRRKRNFDIVRSYLTTNTNVKQINIRSELLDYKQKLPIHYYKTDTHWNNFGSFVAYLKIINTVKTHFKQLKTLNWGDTFVKKEIKHKTDLAKILSIWNDLEVEERNLKLKTNNRKNFKRIGKKGKFLAKETHIIETKNESGPVLLLLRDSFSTAMIPFYEHSFSKIIATHHNYGNWDTSILANEKPDVVIFEVVERYLGKEFITTKF